MISDKSRADWFGASDVSRIIGKRNTKTFENWWLEKIGLRKNTFTNEAMAAGTHYEHRILDSIGVTERDRQILIPEKMLRINLDGNTDDTIYEIKTYRAEKGFSVPIGYKRQVWVQMYAYGVRKAFIVAYGLKDEDYRNFFNEIDKERLSYYPIEYNEKFINETFLPKLNELIGCYKTGMFPKGD